jgi:tetratricopeptide (TPR) repeat protein
MHRRSGWSVRVRACLAAGAIAAALTVQREAAGAQSPAPAASVVSPGSPADASAASLERAHELFSDTKYREAIDVLDAYIRLHPRDARAYVLRGDSFASIDKDDDALRDYNTALKIDPEYEYAYVTRCQTRLDRGDSSGALDDCNAAIRLDSDDAQAYEFRADVRFDRDQYAEAVADYALAIEHGRKRAYTYAAKCDAERHIRSFKPAAVDCDRALTIDPKNARGLWAAGRLALAQNDAVAGVANFNGYIALKKTDTENAFFFRGAGYNRLQKWALALDDLNVFLKAYPHDGDGFTERAIAESELHDTTSAEADFASALKWYRHDGDDSGVARVIALIAAMHTNGPLTMPPL